MLFSRMGKAVRFRTSRVRRVGRVAKGVRGMRLKGDDRVIALNVLLPGSGCQLLTITEKGFGKRTAEELYPTKGRGTQGVIGILTSKRNGLVVGSLTVWPGDQVMLISDQGTVLRTNVDTIRLTGRNAQGVKVLAVAEGETVASVARLAESETSEENNEEPEDSHEGNDGDEMAEAGSSAALDETEVEAGQDTYAEADGLKDEGA